ncbi:MAG: hypothetical protein ACR2KS_10160 [Candidatus Eremiobacter antarcticus]|nr:hypothetical protein [Candidatus Eremiobacteraeota bacterium]MBC5808797.1 hypothetical protein [Candidatus Eremiobacteraeota bacterium]
MSKTYAVIQPDSPSYGLIVSRHRTRAAAEESIGRTIALLRRVPGYSQAYLDREVVEIEASDRADRVLRVCAALTTGRGE